MFCFRILPLLLLVAGALGSAVRYGLAGKYYFNNFAKNNVPPSTATILEGLEVEGFTEDLLEVPDRLDYRKQGLVTPVRKARDNSCYYAAIEIIEGLSANITGKLVPLSVDQAIDCTNISNYLPFNVFVYMMYHDQGCESEADYGEEDNPSKCHYDSDKVKVIIQAGIVGDLSTIKSVKKNLIHWNAPGAIALHMSKEMLNYNGKGVLTPTDCNSEEPNYSGLLVGYDTDPDTGKNYWIIKTSLGPDYGDGGYLNLDMTAPCVSMKDGFMSASVYIIE